MPSNAGKLTPGLPALPNARVPGLDGLRAVAVGLVVFDHFCQSGLLPFYPLYNNFVDPGNIGVRIFFVISGFIITSLLIREQKHEGTVSLRAFYIRRCFRILPLLVAFVTVIFISRWLLYQRPPLWDLLTIATFNVDYVQVKTMDFGHLWSLSVEEKFYLIWPLVFAKCSRRTALRVVCGTILLCPFLRMSGAQMGEGYMQLIAQFHNSCDALAIGCGLALIRSGLEMNSAWKLLTKYRLVIPLSAVVFLAASLTLRSTILFCLFGSSLYNISICALVAYCIGQPARVVAYALNNRVIRWFGSISYGLYLWQQPLTFHKASHVSWLSHPGLNIIVLITTAALTFYLIEEPARKIGRRIASRGIHAKRPSQLPSL
jgi:peptidoglycan/LPS O-acetylase OafA/YrhL